MTAASGDLVAEGDYLAAIVSEPGVDLALPTPAPGWTIGQQIGHLVWTDRLATLACTDADLFGEQRDAYLTAPGVTVDAGAMMEASRSRDELLEIWLSGRTALAAALSALAPDIRVPWLGPPMTAGTLVVARIMETWAHGVDITDALGLPPSQTSRLQHVADLGVRTRNFAYRNRSMTPPEAHFRVELSGPDDQPWQWGPADATDRISGPALDFCLLVTQRRCVDDLRLEITGHDAEVWIRIAQAYAGPPGPGRAAA